MKAITGLVVVLLAILPCRAQQSGKEAAPQVKTPDYYPLKVGCKWHYLVELDNGRKVVFLHQIAKIENVDGKRRAHIETVINGQVKNVEQVGTDNTGVFRYSTGEVPLSPPPCLLKYPIKEGESWTTEMTVGQMPSKVSVKTGIREEVKVPAGKYQAISVLTEMVGGGSRVRITTWYAPEVGIIKESVERQSKNVTMELLKFEPGK